MLLINKIAGFEPTIENDVEEERLPGCVAGIIKFRGLNLRRRTGLCRCLDATHSNLLNSVRHRNLRPCNFIKLGTDRYTHWVSNSGGAVKVGTS